MCSQRFVIVALSALFAIFVSLATARPQKREVTFESVSLAEAVNRTICPIKVVINTVEGRVPKHIKLIKCDERAMDECPADGSDDNCCRRVSNTWRQCYQIEEFVPVRYADNSETTFKAQIGCACMTQEGSMPKEII